MFPAAERIRNIGIAKARKHMAQIRCAEKTGGQMIIVASDVLHQPFSSLCPQIFRQHIKIQRQHIRCLRAGYKPARWRNIFFYKRILDPFQQIGIGSNIILFTQYVSRIYKQLRGVCKKTLGDQVFIGNSRAAIVVISGR